MIPIAPPDIARQFEPGQKVNLKVLCDIALAKQNHPYLRTLQRVDGHPFGRYPAGERNPLNSSINTTSKHWYQNTCHCASGKCERCKAAHCADRDWRKRGLDVP